MRHALLVLLLAAALAYALALAPGPPAPPRWDQVEDLLAADIPEEDRARALKKFAGAGMRLDQVRKNLAGCRRPWALRGEGDTIACYEWRSGRGWVIVRAGPDGVVYRVTYRRGDREYEVGRDGTPDVIDDSP